MDTSITGARAWRIRYVSRDVHDVAHEVSGLVIAPAGPGANRPILTWCHGTTGLGDAACPSAQPDPARELITYFEPRATQQIDYGVPGLQGFIDDGWVVCATDYQGLGTPGMHQYVVNRTNGRDAVYAAHAARALDAGAGTVLGCAGWSQGGGAAAAVAELDADDYGELRLVGTVPISPGVSRIALEVPSGITRALTDPSVPPDSHLVMMLAGIQAANPATLTLGEVFTPLGVRDPRDGVEYPAGAPPQRDHLPAVPAEGRGARPAAAEFRRLEGRRHRRVGGRPQTRCAGAGVHRLI